MKYYFSVTGKGDFPFNMLAISKAYPADAHEAHKIALSCPTVAPQQTIWLETSVHPVAVSLWKENHWPVEKIIS